MSDATDDGERRSAGIRRSGLVGIVTKAAQALITFAVLPVLVRALGPESYGVYAAATTVAVFLTWSDLGVGLALMSRLAKVTEASDADAARRIVSNTWVIMWLMALVLVPLGAVSSWVIPWPGLINSHLPTHEIKLALDVFLATTFLGVPAAIGLRIMQAHQQGAGANIWMLVSTSSGAVVPALLALSHAPLWIIIASTNVAMMIVYAIQTIVVFRSNRHLLPRRGDIKLAEVRRTLRHGALFLTLTVIAAVAYQCDTLVISAFLGARHAGIFTTTARPFTAGMVVISMYNVQLWPAVAEASGKGDVIWIQHALWKAVRLMATVSAPLILLAVVVWRPLAGALFGSAFTPPWSLEIAVGIWTFQQVVGSPIAYVLNGLSVVGFQVVASVMMGVANLALSIVLVHSFGISGPVWASVITHATLLLMPSMFYTVKILPKRLQAHPDTGLSV